MMSYAANVRCRIIEAVFYCRLNSKEKTKKGYIHLPTKAKNKISFKKIGKGFFNLIIAKERL